MVRPARQKGDIIRTPLPRPRLDLGPLGRGRIDAPIFTKCYHIDIILLMATIIIRDLPDDLHQRLKAQARRNHRSLTKEAVALIERHLGPLRPAAELPPPLHLKAGPVTIKQIEAAISRGRD